jgi:hypothetical protein
MAFVAGDWDSLERILHSEVASEIARRYNPLPVHTGIGSTVAYVSTRPQLPSGLAYQFNTIDTRSPNAFAIPGGGIYITTGLLNEISGKENAEDMLAFVFAHEVAHVAQSHWKAAVQQTYVGDFWRWFAARVVTKGKAAVLGELVPLVLKTAYAGYSREQEREADRLGLRFMVAAGYNPDGAIDLLTVLGRGERPGEVSLWASHPKIEERLQNVRHEISSIRTQRESEVNRLLATTDRASGVVAISIAPPRGSFPAIGSDIQFDSFQAEFFPETERETYRRAAAGEGEASFTRFLFGSSGIYNRVLPAGRYVVIYKAEKWKQRFTAYDVLDNGWGPLRVTVRPGKVTYVQVAPTGESAGVFGGGASQLSEGMVNHEFVRRFVLNEQTLTSYSADFGPLPVGAATISDMLVTSSDDVIAGEGAVVMQAVGSMLSARFRIDDGSPTQASLVITCSSRGVPPADPAQLTVVVNGHAVSEDYSVFSGEPMSRAWDIGLLVTVGDNVIMVERTGGGGTVAVEKLVVAVYGAGLGSFFRTYHGKE